MADPTTSCVAHLQDAMLATTAIAAVLAVDPESFDLE